MFPPPDFFWISLKTELPSLPRSSFSTRTPDRVISELGRAFPQRFGPADHLLAMSLPSITPMTAAKSGRRNTLAMRTMWQTTTMKTTMEMLGRILTPTAGSWTTTTTIWRPSPLWTEWAPPPFRSAVWREQVARAIRTKSGGWSLSFHLSRALFGTLP